MHLKSTSMAIGAAAATFFLFLPAQAQQRSMPPGHPPVGKGQGASVHSASPSAQTLVGTVMETIDASSYTYVQVETGTRSVWAAAPRFPVKKGDRVSIPTHSPMQNYRSDSLGRTFPLVYFAEKIRVASSGKPHAMLGMGTPTADKNMPHPSPRRVAPQPGISLEGITKPEGGRTVGEVFDEGRALAGRDVSVRGRVVKYSPRIMGTNWLHLQDGTTGSDGSNDLVITTDDRAAVGDLVLIRGRLGKDRDFGHGYTYDVIIEGASVTLE